MPVILRGPWGLYAAGARLELSQADELALVRGAAADFVSAEAEAAAEAAAQAELNLELKRSTKPASAPMKKG